MAGKEKNFQFMVIPVSKDVRILDSSFSGVRDDAVSEVFRKNSVIFNVQFKGKEAILVGDEKKADEEEEMNTIVNCLFGKIVFGDALLIQKSKIQRKFKE